MTEPLTLDNIFKLLEIISIIGGGGLVAFRLGSASKSVQESTRRFERGMETQGSQISALQSEIKALSKLVTEVAVQNQRLDTQDRRLDTHERRIDELAHGEGLVMPFNFHTGKGG